MSLPLGDEEPDDILMDSTTRRVKCTDSTEAVDVIVNPDQPRSEEILYIPPPLVTSSSGISTAPLLPGQRRFNRTVCILLSHLI